MQVHWTNDGKGFGLVTAKTWTKLIWFLLFCPCRCYWSSGPLVISSLHGSPRQVKGSYVYMILLWFWFDFLSLSPTEKNINKHTKNMKREEYQHEYTEYQKRRSKKYHQHESTCDSSIHFCKEHILNHPPTPKASLIFRPHLISRQGSGDCLGVSIGTPNPRYKKLKNSYLWLRLVTKVCKLNIYTKST